MFEQALAYLQNLVHELDSLPDEAEPDLMLRDHPGKQVKLQHIARARTNSERWMLIAWRFPWLFKTKEEEQGKPPADLADIQKMQRTAMTGPPPPEVEGVGVGASPAPAVAAMTEDDLQIDLAKLRALPREELTHRNGTVNKSAVARALNRSKGGGSWSYIDEVAAHYQAELDEADQLAGWDEETAGEPPAGAKEAA